MMVQHARFVLGVIDFSADDVFGDEALRAARRISLDSHGRNGFAIFVDGYADAWSSKIFGVFRDKWITVFNALTA